MSDQGLLQFPCDFPIKIMGQNTDDFAQSILDIVLRHYPDFDAKTTELRPSSKGAYLGVTCVLRPQSQEELDALYRELTSHPLVKMVL